MISSVLTNIVGISSQTSFSPMRVTTSEVDCGAWVLTGVLLTLVAIYTMSKVGGELSKRLNLSPFLGELIGGVIIGISVLHLLVFPEAGSVASDSVIMTLLRQLGNLDATAIDEIFQSQSEIISVLAELGAVILLFEIGLESDLRDLSKVSYQAAVIAVVGVVVPFALSTAGLVTLFHVPLIPSIFSGAALSATSIGITSKLLSGLGHLKSREGQMIVGAAVIDDVLGIIILAVVASLAKTGEVDRLNVMRLMVIATAFLLGSILLGRWINLGFAALSTRLKTRGALLIPAITFAFVMAILASVIHIEAILGAFAAGLVLDETDLRKELDRQVMPIADLLVPIFFVTVGAKADLGVLNPTNANNRAGLIIAMFLMTAAILGKAVTGWAIVGQPGINRLAIGMGMIPRGEVGLVFAEIGVSGGVLSQSLNVAIIIMVILTTFLAPLLLQLAFKRQSEPETVGPIPIWIVDKSP